jgi:hypothetical protein
MAPVFAQSVAINTDGSLPNANAILDVKSGNKGILIPRMNTTARNAIPNTKGLLVYDTTTNGFWYNTGTGWQGIAISALSTPLAVGSAWLLTGNSGTSDATNFLGTTDNVPLNIRVNNQRSGRIDSARRATFWGYRAGSSDSGISNTAIGAFALKVNTSGGYNTAIGHAALSNNTTGSSNTATGQASLLSNTTGSNNTADGLFALTSNTTGFNNTASGVQALYLNTTGYKNTASGVQSLNSNTTGWGNTAQGYQSLFSNITGGYNVANGSQALYSNTEGTWNTASGFQALYSNGTGTGNTADGYWTLKANTQGFYNTAIGQVAMLNNTSGYENVAVGESALAFNTTGPNNTGCGVNALENNTEGYQNTAVGIFTLTSNTTGGNNTAIGAFSDVSASNLTNATVIGYGATVDASNKVRIGNSAVTVIEGQVPFTTPSDGRFKFHVQEDVKGLDFILHLRPVTYQFDTKRFDAQMNHQANIQGGPENYALEASYDEATRIRRSGFIAQEVEQAAQASGYDFSGIVRPRTEQDHYSLSYEAFVVPLVKAVQEQEMVIREQDKKIASLQQQLDEIKKLLQKSK